MQCFKFIISYLIIVSFKLDEAVDMTPFIFGGLGVAINVHVIDGHSSNSWMDGFPLLSNLDGGVAVYKAFDELYATKLCTEDLQRTIEW